MLQERSKYLEREFGIKVGTSSTQNMFNGSQLHHTVDRSSHSHLKSADSTSFKETITDRTLKNKDKANSKNTGKLNCSN